MANCTALDAGIPVDPRTDISDTEIDLAAIRGFIRDLVTTARKEGLKGTPEMATELDRKLAKELSKYPDFRKEDALRINFQLTEFHVHIIGPDGHNHKVE